jgi:tRNA threonylcarbamoyladenosine biosynthesis protein TsaE
MTFELRLRLVGEAATAALGRTIGSGLRRGDVVALTGDLGAGKTSLVRGLAHGLGIAEPEAVASPTYLLAVEHPGPVPLVHLDAYLPEKLRRFLQDGGVDYLAERDGVTAVEWADRVADLLPPDALHVELRPLPGSPQPAREAILHADEARFGWLRGSLAGMPPGG